MHFITCFLFVFIIKYSNMSLRKHVSTAMIHLYDIIDFTKKLKCFSSNNQCNNYWNCPQTYSSVCTRFPLLIVFDKMFQPFVRSEGESILMWNANVSPISLSKAKLPTYLRIYYRYNMSVKQHLLNSQNTLICCKS